MSLPDTLMLGTGTIAFLYLISRVLTKTIWPEMRPRFHSYAEFLDSDCRTASLRNQIIEGE